MEMFWDGVLCFPEYLYLLGAFASFLWYKPPYFLIAWSEVTIAAYNLVQVREGVHQTILYVVHQPSEPESSSKTPVPATFDPEYSYNHSHFPR